MNSDNTDSRAPRARLAGLGPGQWQRAGRHEAAGDLTVQLYEAHMASEDVDHLAQIARLISQPPLE
jgi:hypothetical protein